MSGTGGGNPFDNPFGGSAAAGTGGIQWGASSGTGAWGSSAQHSAVYELETTYVPPSSMDTVPSAWGQQPQGAWANTPAAAAAPTPSTFLLPASTTIPSDATVPSVPTSTAKLAFTDSTAAPVVRGTLGSGVSAYRDDGTFAFQPASSTADSRPLLTTSQQQAAAASSTSPASEDPSKYAFYNIRKYRPYFNVDTAEVLWRVTSSFIGAFKPDFMQVTHTQPDLYGPFWIATTLIFVTAAAGNFSSYIAWKQQHEGEAESGVNPGQWFADTTKLGTSAAMFYGYTFLISLVLWLWVRMLKADVQLVNMFCVYGYALTIFIPISVLCVVPVETVRWVFVVLATLLSGGFLLMNIRSAVSEVELQRTFWLLGAVVVAHLGLGVALKLFFFNY